MGIVYIDGIEVCQAVCHSYTQPTNRATASDGAYNIGVENNLANGMGSSGDKEINSTLEVVEEILFNITISGALERKLDSYRRNHPLPRRWSSVSNGYAFGRPPDSVFPREDQAPSSDLAPS